MHKVTISSINNESLLDNLNISGLTDFVLSKVGAPAKSIVSVNFINSDEIQRLNNQFRNLNKPTDVLSFECDGVQNDEFKLLNKSNCEHDLGDIFICIEEAKSNADKYNTNLNSELELLIVHGLLHLCGYDHIDNKQAIIMEKKEDELLADWHNKHSS